MSYFPMFIELKDKPCLIAGGGKVALRKAETLLDFGARVTGCGSFHPAELQRGRIACREKRLKL